MDERHAQQHTARAGAGYQAHLGEHERRQAQRHRSTIVRARTLPWAARLATLLQPRRLGTPLLLERLLADSRSGIGLKWYSDRIALAILYHFESAALTPTDRGARGIATRI